MYTTCLFCHGDLGRNEAIEAFPVGRRLAYDAERGRLWVVCRRCERWNLTPQEERWEAIEQAERLYGATRLRAATDNVGLARLREGTELVRVGRPLRPEFAAWRYGDQFGRRRMRQMAVAGAGIVLVGGVVAGGVAAGVSVASFGGLIQMAVKRIVHGPRGAVVARVPTAAGGLVEVKRKHLAHTAIVGAADGAMGVRIWRRSETVELAGADAERAVSMLLPVANRYGGSRREVGDAVQVIERAGGSEALMGDIVARTAATRTGRPAKRRPNEKGGLLALDTVSRLALEMALHEEEERRAMHGELATLEAAWRDAEEIAAIADGLLLPDGVEARFDQLKARSSARAGAASSPSSESGGASSS